MVRFAHIGDCHLGCWRQEALQDLNFKSFQEVVKRCLSENLDFVLIAGDLFDSAYPPIEILKAAFAEFKKLHDAGLPVYLIAGSHDYSASGKTFLDVLEKAGFCINVSHFAEEEDGRIKCFPTMHNDIAIYGYPGKKTGMEINDLRRAYIDPTSAFSIFMIHTTIKDVVGTIPMESLETKELPIADYYAMGHIHQIFDKQERNGTFVYPCPTFPANFQELMDLKHGRFVIVEENNRHIKFERIEIPLKEVAGIVIEITDALRGTGQIIATIDKLSLQDKIVLLKLHGTLIQGKTGDIDFMEIETFVHRKGAYAYLRNISAIKAHEEGMEAIVFESSQTEHIENKIMEEFVENNKENPFATLMPSIMSALCMEKIEDEKSAIFEERLLDELRSVLELKGVL